MEPVTLLLLLAGVSAVVLIAVASYLAGVRVGARASHRRRDDRPADPSLGRRIG